MTMKKSKRKKKPGPRPTGLKRTILFPLMLSGEEWEHLTRLEQSYFDATGDRMKKAPLIRARVFPVSELEELRKEQGANINVNTGINKKTVSGRRVGM